MSKRSRRSRSDRRAAAASQRREAGTEPISQPEVKVAPRVGKSGSRKRKGLAALMQNRSLLWGGVALLIVIVLVLIWLFATPWSPLSKPVAPQPSAAPTSSAEAAGTKSWPKPPDMTIGTSKTYYATIKTEKGDIRLQLYADKAPKTVNNFVFLSRQGFYDNTTFHRVIPDFMAQAGDPTGTGTGGPGYRFEDEFDPALKHDDVGIISMANTGDPNTNGSQFFITYAPQPHLDGKHSVFGKVVEGMDVLQAISPRDPATAATPGTKILTIVIEEK